MLNGRYDRIFPCNISVLPMYDLLGMTCRPQTDLIRILKLGLEYRVRRVGEMVEA